VSYSLATEQNEVSPFTGFTLMQPLWGNMAALAVAIIFYVYRAHLQVRLRRQRVLHVRVAYMLWVMAQHVGAAAHYDHHELSRG
jgi:hypothetical protein